MEAQIPRFFFDLYENERLCRDEDGIELPDAEAAFMEAFKAATEMWGEALRARRDPRGDLFKIRDGSGRLIIEVPFIEKKPTIQEGRHARPKPGTTGAASRKVHPSSSRAPGTRARARRRASRACGERRNALTICMGRCRSGSHRRARACGSRASSYPAWTKSWAALVSS
jgi:hypothetical protein